jgi:transposase-like protein
VTSIPERHAQAVRDADEIRAADLEDLLEQGDTVRTLAARYGVAPSTISRWLHAADKDTNKA